MSWIREQFTFHDLQRLLFKLSEHVKAFQGLTPAEISELLSRAEKCTYAAGATIVREGNIGTHMYVILDGVALVTKKGRDGEMELARLFSTDSFGEMALTDNEARCATVSAVSPCVLVRLSDQSVSARPEIAMKVYRNIARVVSERLRNADEALVWRL